eukprot:m.133919 g.133919  ORF g.133919 m.133919 type:complete len:246 (+) comp15811_c0_seq2:471-1208(+)
MEMAPTPLPASGSYTTVESLLVPDPIRGNAFGTTEEQDEPECPICLEFCTRMPLYRLKGCGHAFHLECLREWLNYQTTCPLCRTLLHAAIDLRYKGHCLVDNRSAEPKAMHALLHRLVERVASAGMFSRFNRSVRGGFNCDAASINFTTKECLTHEQPHRSVPRLFKRKCIAPSESNVNISLSNMREIYCRGRYCLLATLVPGCGNQQYRVYIFDARNATRAAAVFARLREVCEPRAYIRGVRYE